MDTYDTNSLKIIEINTRKYNNKNTVNNEYIGIILILNGFYFYSIC
jgi:hypothetical protein